MLYSSYPNSTSYCSLFMHDRIDINLSASSWSEDYWNRIESQTRYSALHALSEDRAWEAIIKRARLVLRSFSTSFFIVTRFLPPSKRARVEAIYAAVRYPDEIVDTFPLDNSTRLRRLDEWGAHYE